MRIMKNKTYKQISFLILLFIVVQGCTPRKEIFDCPCDGNGLITLEGFDREDTEIILTAIEEAFGGECCQVY
jgi:hypothetical protein